MRLTGITNDMAGEAPELIAGLRGFLEFVSHKVLVAHGSGHDKHFLNSALWKTSRIKFSHRLLDTMMIGKWLHPGMKKYGLDELLDCYGIEIAGRHHALEDALMTARLWTKMLQEVRDREICTLGDLYEKLSIHV